MRVCLISVRIEQLAECLVKLLNCGLLGFLNFSSDSIPMNSNSGYSFKLGNRFIFSV